MKEFFPLRYCQSGRCQNPEMPGEYFSLCVHDERTAADDRFINRCASLHQGLRAYLRRVRADDARARGAFELIGSGINQIEEMGSAPAHYS